MTPASVPVRFRDELRDFFRYLRRPRFTPRLPGRNARDGWLEDWLPSLSVGRLLKWALFLWMVNLAFLGPIAVAAAGLGGATHRLNLENIPWLQALLWAPIVEELVFRHGLRRLTQAWWLIPASVAVMFTGPQWAGILMLTGVLVLCWLPGVVSSGIGRRPLPWKARLAYRKSFPWVFHASAILFAAVHLYNFNLHQTPYWLLPLLVLPQWLTGLVLGWLRMKRGIGASMLLHALFNGGPLLIVWVVIQLAPELAV